MTHWRRILHSTVLAVSGLLLSASAPAGAVAAAGEVGAFVRGDANGDGTVDIGDPVTTLSFLFSGGVVACLDAADSNDDGLVNIADAVTSLSLLFGPLGTLPAPYPEAGQDPTPDDHFCDPLLADLEIHVASILSNFPTFGVTSVPASGSTLGLADSLVVDDIRGVIVDATPPLLQGPVYTGPASMVDGFAPGDAPYVAPGILPFDFDHFTPVNSYQGWHTWNLAEYASTHGFAQHDPYNSVPSAWSHLPQGVDFYTWTGWNWETWMTAQGIASGRYDLLPPLASLTATLHGESFLYASGDPLLFSNSMADLEHGVLSPTNLQAQPWYPSSGTPAEQEQFELDYYDGFAHTHMSWMDVAEQNQWTGYGIYGWQPFARQWWGLESATGDPQTDWRWQRFGSRIYDEVEVLYPSIYCFYWNQRNLAYMLANLDLQHTIAAEKQEQKPTWPFVWALLHGGGGGWRWWKNQPIPDTDMQAMFAMLFFAEIEGFVLWDWSGTGDPHRVNLAVDDNWLVETPFAVAPVGMPGQLDSFEQYDVIHVTAIDPLDNVEFKFIDKADPNGSLAAPTTYVMPRATLEALLRPRTAGLDAMFEGLALARVFEFLLWHGQLHVDVPATKQWGQNLPVVRRMKLGNYHVIAGYDAFFADHPGGRSVTLTDFDGVPGRTLTIPVDSTIRIWLLRDEP